MNDWDHDGDIDVSDYMLEEEFHQETGGGGGAMYGGSGGFGCGGGLFMAAVVFISATLFLALIFGIDVPGAVLEFFFYLILIVGLFAIGLK